MVEDFVEKIANELNLHDSEVTVLRTAGIRSFEDMDSLVGNFPTIHTLGVRIPFLSAMAASRVTLAYARAKAGNHGRGQVPVAHGARHPRGAVWPPGRPVPAAPPSGSGPPGGASAGRIDLRVAPWPVRDQGQRGTCIAFASTACVEHKRCRASSAGPDDHSEQFLYWAIKTRTADPWPSTDGTSLEFARDAMASEGICLEADWPYVPALLPANIPQGGNGNPSPVALAAAGRNTHVRAAYLSPPPGQGAAAVLSAIMAGRPVAVSLPVFRDPQMPPQAPDNWTTNSGWLYGRVMNPPPTAVVAGGHAVCITGFVPDAAEPGGGYFVFRNSWGVQWASAVPSPGASHAPEPGYGEVSASYVDTYMWEMLQF